MIDSKSYFKSTKANFTSCDRPDREPDYVSASGSAYWYGDEGVVRSSDHWGKGIASCDWHLDGESVSSWDPVCGFCAWSAFEFNRPIVVRIIGLPDGEGDSWDTFGDGRVAHIEVKPEDVHDGLARTPYGDVEYDAYGYGALYV